MTALTGRQRDEFDRAHIWHPYASISRPNPVYKVESAQGVYLTLADGRSLIDGMSSWWAAIHGYGHPVLNAAAAAQLEKMSHVMFGGLTHDPAIELCSRLVELTPGPLTKVFLSDSGSVSVEVAIKMALQYQQAKGRPDKNRLLTVRSGYHGDTLGAMAVCDPIKGMHARFRGLLARHLFADPPTPCFGEEWEEGHIQGFKDLLRANHGRVAAVILEPVVQGAGGMRFYHPRYLERVRELTREYETLLILDEIATGFGRTGSMFACHRAKVSPDIMCLGKALTGGYLSLAATLTTDEVGRTIGSEGSGELRHGPTFMGNPLACAVASASIDLLLSGPWQERVERIQGRLGQGLAPCRGLTGVKDVRVLGAIGVVELEEPVDLETMQAKFVEAGVWLRPFGRLVYTMPPYIITDEELERVTGAMVKVIEGQAKG